MSDLIDIKTKKIIPKLKIEKFDRSLVLENLEKNIISHYDTWGAFQQSWGNKAYRVFKDFDKYIVMMFLIRNYWQNLSDKFNYLSMDEFYDSENVTIDKINLIHISTELNIPKETIRRKVNELQNAGILVRKGKSIIFNKRGVNYHKPDNIIQILSTFIQKKSNLLQGSHWFGAALKKEEIQKFINKYFTIVWLRFFKLQIPFLIRHRNIFQDLETWVVWGNIALNHQDYLRKALEKNVLHENIDINRYNYYKNMADFKIERGINASSIADISSIPRATVIRKLKWLMRQDVIKKTKNLEYQLKGSGKLHKMINQNTIINQNAVADFLTDIFDYIKNSNFKI
jgi:predicted transcriptional regulator